MAGRGSGIDADGDEVEHHARQQGIEIREAVDDHGIAAPVADGAAGDDGEARGAAREVLQRQGIGGGGIGMIGALGDGPGQAGSAGGKRGRAGLARIERLDGDAIGGAAHQHLVEGLALQHGVDGSAPGGFRRGRELGGERERCVGRGHGVGHAASMPRRMPDRKASFGRSGAPRRNGAMPLPPVNHDRRTSGAKPQAAAGFA